MKLGLSDSESMVMYMLYDTQDPLTQSDIVKATGLSKQTLNSAIRKLEKEGIIILEKLNEKSKRNTIRNTINKINVKFRKLPNRMKIKYILFKLRLL